MANKRDREALARAAARFSAPTTKHTQLPSLVLVTDDMRLADPLAATCALPPGSLVLLRARDSTRRAELALAIAQLAQRRGLRWIVAGDPELATRARADGIHFAERDMAAALHWRARRPHWLITAAAHSLATCSRAAQLGVDAVFLSPLFPTGSHPGHAGLNPLRARRIAELSPLPVYALGGIDAATVRRLEGGAFAGIAAIGALSA